MQTTLSRTSAGATAAAAILTGPQNYLLLAGNNAEMRSGSGMFLEAGNVAISDGDMHLQGMQPTWSLILPGREPFPREGIWKRAGGSSCRGSTTATSVSRRDLT